MKREYWFYLIICLTLIIDQVVKFIVTNSIELNSSITIIPNFFYLTYVKNTGGAFSILNDQVPLLIMIALIAVVVILTIYKKEKRYNLMNLFGYGLLLGGTLGNLFDRIVYHSVTDYLHFIFGSYSFPVFNIADIAITIGIGLIILEMIVGDLREKNHSR